MVFSVPERARSARTAKARAATLRQAVAVALEAGGGQARLSEVWKQIPPEEQHITSIRALLGHLLHEGVRLDRSGWVALDFGQVDGTRRTAYVPDATITRPSREEEN